MDLVIAFRLDDADHSGSTTPPRLAFVGSGGKTTALFQLARGLLAGSQSTTSRVLVFPTTHLAVGQLTQADQHFYIEKTDDITSIEQKLPSGVILFTGQDTGNGRVSGLDAASQERIFSIAETEQCPLLVEADGSRQRPLKAPSDFEPVIPSFINCVVVVAGLSALGQPLASGYVHRPERFSLLSGVAPGTPITPQALAEVLLHPQGGLKNIPPGTRRIVLFNQADTPELQAMGQSLARQVLPVYDAAVITSLNHLGSSHLDQQDQPCIRDKMPSIGNGQDLNLQTSSLHHRSSTIFAVHEPVAGVIMAAGGSRRMGEPKQLLLWHGIPLIRHVVATTLRAGLTTVVVVTGANGERVQAALEGLPVIMQDNPSWEAGLSTSLKAGLQAISSSIGSVVFMLADQPQVPVTLVRGLIERHSVTLAPIVAPLVKGQRANPTLFDRVTFPDLLSIEGDIGGRVLFSRYPVEWMPWQAESVMLDVDTEEDYQSLLLV